MMEAAWARLTSVKTCLRFLFRRAAGFQLVDLKGLLTLVMSLASWRAVLAVLFGAIADDVCE